MGWKEEGSERGKKEERKAASRQCLADYPPPQLQGPAFAQTAPNMHPGSAM